MQDMMISDYLQSVGAARVIEASAAQDRALIGAAMRVVLDHAAGALAADERTALVSLTLDELGPVVAGEAVRFETRLDRQTRTLIFMSAEARSGTSAVLKATAIYRIG